jgi:hypothetical protein
LRGDGIRQPALREVSPHSQEDGEQGDGDDGDAHLVGIVRRIALDCNDNRKWRARVRVASPRHRNEDEQTGLLTFSFF